MSILTIADETVMNRIYYLRKHKVMLDKDLAILYGVKPIRLREQVKRNRERFPANFMFQLTSDEAANMLSQNAILSRQQMGGHFPYAFTEHGVLMLAAILRNEKAMQVSVRIIEIFVKMREMLMADKDILVQLQKAEKRLAEHDDDIQQILSCLNQLMNTPQEPRARIGFRRKDETE